MKTFSVRYRRVLSVTFAVVAGMTPLGFAQSANHVQLAKAANTNPVPAVYQRWVDEDVRWIIKPDERAAFLQLTTDDARDQFIEHFWNQRDPTPVTVENEFKEEYYRRIAYSNAHFATSRQGWQSDRGHIYIVYGPPDGIRQEKVDGNPAEAWHYNLFSASTTILTNEKLPPGGKADLEFVDKCKCNDYRLTTPELP